MEGERPEYALGSPVRRDIRALAFVYEGLTPLSLSLPCHSRGLS